MAHGIAKNKNAYYDALEKSQAGWDERKENPVPFIKYLLGTIIAAYRDFEERMEIVSESDARPIEEQLRDIFGVRFYIGIFESRIPQ